MTRITGPDCAVMCNLINTHTGAGTGLEQGRGWGPVDEQQMGTGTVAEMGTKTTITGIGSGRAEERRKSARNRKMVVDAVRETGETRVERDKM